MVERHLIGYFCPKMPDGPLIPPTALYDPCGEDVPVFSDGTMGISSPRERTTAPRWCLYCDGKDPNCGFCDFGQPLDTQEDWDNSWGRIFDV